MDPVSLTASAIAILQISGTIISLCYDYRSRVKSAAKEASRIVNELNGLRSVLDSLFVLLEDEAAAPTQHSALDRLVGNDGPLIRCLTELEALREKLEPKGGWRAVKAAIIWPLKESDVKKVLHDIDSTKSTVQLALEVDQRKATMSIQNTVISLNQQVSDSVASAHRERVFRWLSATNSFSNHAAARKKCQPMTGLWFLSGDDFKQWVHSPNSVLWIYGIPGCGKTILCSSVIDEVLERYSKDSSAAVAFYYFDFSDNTKSRAEPLLRSIIGQLYAQKPDISDALHGLFEESRNGATQPQAKDLLNLLSCMLREFGPTYIILDALDECSGLDQVLGMLQEIWQWNIEKLHILVTSRRIPEIESLLSLLTASEICLTGSAVNEDIALHIACSLKSDQKLAKWPQDVRDLISRTLNGGARGMFRWVVCQLETLRKCFTFKELKRQLSELPKTLEDTYDQALLRIDEGHRQNSLKILQLLASAAVPVTIEEAAEVLAVDLSGEGCYDKDLRLFDPHDVLTICSSLITRVKVSIHDEVEPMWPYHEYYLRLGLELRHDEHDEPDNPEKDVLQLAHLSVKEYLVSDRIKHSRAHHLAVDTILANMFIARTCLVYLLHPEFSQGYCDEEGVVERSRRWPLYQYAAHFWPFHVRDSGEVLHAAAWELLQRFFSSKTMPNGGNYAAWAVALTPDISLDNVYHTEPLYYAASFGIVSLIQKLVDIYPDIDVDAPGGQFASPPLQVAVYRNHPEAVKLLLRLGANPMGLNNQGESCLFRAVLRGHVEIERILRDHGATLTQIDKQRTVYSGYLFRKYIEVTEEN